jgi:hypothetical protein
LRLRYGRERQRYHASTSPNEVGVAGSRSHRAGIAHSRVLIIDHLEDKAEEMHMTAAKLGFISGRSILPVAGDIIDQITAAVS